MKTAIWWWEKFELKCRRDELIQELAGTFAPIDSPGKKKKRNKIFDQLHAIENQLPEEERLKGENLEEYN